MSNMAYKTKRVKSWMDRFIKVTFWAVSRIYFISVRNVYIMCRLWLTKLH